MPEVKRTEKTPGTTTITFTFPVGRSVDYESDNVILEELTKEYIIKKTVSIYAVLYFKV